MTKKVNKTDKEIELAKIRPNRLNPRFEINVERLNEVASSTKGGGSLEPIKIDTIYETNNLRMFY